MALIYEQAGDGSVRQAELLTSVSELQLVSQTNDEAVETRRVAHPLVMVMSQDCDLEQDFNLRHPEDGDPPSREDAEAQPSALSHILMCDVYGEEELRRRIPSSFGSKDFRRIAGNQNERYHRIDEAEVRGTGDKVESLFLDFRRYFAVPCPEIYDQLQSGPAGRHARLPAYYLHDLNHRFYSYLARVAIP